MTLVIDTKGDLTLREKILIVNGVRYTIEPSQHADVYEHLPLTKVDSLDAALITVIDVGKCPSTLTEDWIQRCIKFYKATDDVFQVQFLHGIIFSNSRCDRSLSPGAKAALEGFGMRWHCFLNESYGQIFPGPYVLLHRTLHEPFRLYADTHATFFSAMKTPQDIDGPDDNCGQVDIGVPSRLRVHNSSTLPLSNIRVGVKDNFDLEGTKTSLCSRSYLQTYPKKTKSAPCIQRLIDQGAFIVGKTKLCAFAQWEEPTEAIEYTSPWSPRADGFQSSGGSSNGSGAAVSAYEWLDIAIGSDTTGSILRPALWNGCFSLRPTFGMLSTEGFVSCIDYLDTPGIMGRELQLCLDFAASWYGDRLDYAFSQFTSVLWPTNYWDMIDSEQRTITENFAHEIASELGLRCTRFSLKEEWERNPPEDAGLKSLNDYMIKATEDIWYDDYHAFDGFREAYWAKNQKAPYITPPTRSAWESCKSISKAERDEAARRVHVFRSWFRATFFNARAPLIIMPIENVVPRYRDESPQFQRPPTGVHALILAALVGAPELVVPISTVPFQSKITEREEHLPFVVGLMGAPGSDLILMETVLRCLKNAGRATSVYTGSEMFTRTKLKDPL